MGGRREGLGQHPFDNERKQCNFGKGGGTFKPSMP
jgi:hypothetical protein